MFERIIWHAMLKVNDEPAATTVVERMASNLGTPLTMRSYERYRKFSDLADIHRTGPLDVLSPEEAFLRALLAGGRAEQFCQHPGDLGGCPHLQVEGPAIEV